MPLSNTLVTLWKPSISLAGSKLVNKGFPGSCIRCFHFLLRLAWESRFRLPIVYAILSFLCDVQMRMEVNMYRERRIVLVENEIEESEDESTSDDGQDNRDDYFLVLGDTHGETPNVSVETSV